MEAWELAVALAGSFVAGFLGSLVGLVPGSLRLPADLLASGSAAAAAGTNIAVSAVAALTGGLAHARAGQVSWRIVALMAPPSIAGTFIGGYADHAVPGRLLLAAIAIVLAWSGLDLLLQLRAAPEARRPRLAAAVSGSHRALGRRCRPDPGHAPHARAHPQRRPARAHRGRDEPLRRHPARRRRLRRTPRPVRSEVEWAVLATCLAGAIPGAWLGARFTGRLDEATLRRSIGVTLVIVAVAIAATALLD